MAKGLKKKIANDRRQAFLIAFFDEPHEYSHKEVNGFMLVRQFNAGNKRWEVAIWDKDTFKRIKGQQSLIN